MLTLPNLVSLARLVAIPWFLWLLLAEGDALRAALVLAVIGATDWVDGWLARGLRQVSELGKLLDPLADRAAIAAAVLGGWAAGVVPEILAIVLVIREGAVALVSLWLALRRLPKLPVRYLGKAATMLLYVSIPAFYLAAAGIAAALLTGIAWVSGAIGALLYYLVLEQYRRDIRSRLAGT
ncbi:MAG: CDP-alcohol phosphatidyltransferase family protein [Actinomycetota bacterium]|nr:CDP-alcohol phosphatidyltransferase family protein [Actinomycetota bacterium]